MLLFEVSTFSLSVCTLGQVIVGVYLVYCWFPKGTIETQKDVHARRARNITALEYAALPHCKNRGIELPAHGMI